MAPPTERRAGRCFMAKLSIASFIPHNINKCHDVVHHPLTQKSERTSEKDPELSKVARYNGDKPSETSRIRGTGTERDISRDVSQSYSTSTTPSCPSTPHKTKVQNHKPPYSPLNSSAAEWTPTKHNSISHKKTNLKCVTSNLSPPSKP